MCTTNRLPVPQNAQGESQSFLVEERYLRAESRSKQIHYSLSFRVAPLLLLNLFLSFPSEKNILEELQNSRFEAACTRYFEVMHNVQRLFLLFSPRFEPCFSPDTNICSCVQIPFGEASFVVQSPNQYFDMSRQLHGDTTSKVSPNKNDTAPIKNAVTIPLSVPASTVPALSDTTDDLDDDALFANYELP